MSKGTGIHGNEGCAQCGACCVYFDIFTEEDVPQGQDGLVVSGRLQQSKLWKRAGEVCKYLGFDEANKKTYCKNRDDQYEQRPHACSKFGCYDGHSLECKPVLERQRDVAGLIATAEKMFNDQPRKQVNVKPWMKKAIDAGFIRA